METLAKNKSIVRADEVVGVKVINLKEEDLGSIFQLVIDKVSGQVRYAVLKSGTFLGLGGKFFAIPWSSLKYDTANDAFRVNLSKERLKNAPGFDENNWPEFSDSQWNTTIKNYYTAE